MPFLDLSMIRLGQLIPPELKIVGSPPIEKWILRKAFEDLLPLDIVWRAKEQFDEGSGTVDMLENVLAGVNEKAEKEAYQERFPEARLRSAEECHYHRLFMEVFEQSELLQTNVARWADRPSWNDA